ncbi:MAG: bifunctional response regulator/alkaline phosphatase family protein [Bacteroidota bacterium]|nr:bifunctional response regulator/alkaline phosphatase family protein [Bacteroidota bacterium]
MSNIKILWVDDEIDLLKPQVIFLESKGHIVSTTNNGASAIEMVQKENFNIVFLDEQMPGLSGLETLSQIKRIFPALPVIMITKSEEESIMDEAIGSQITDYLIKPVNPKQILLAIKKIVDKKSLITQKTTSGYQSEFGSIGMMINDSLSYTDWVDVYKKLVYWELELDRSNDSTMDEVLKMQKTEANSTFARFIEKNYFDWFKKDIGDRPLLSPDIFKHVVFPQVDDNNNVIVLVIDNLRFDQWKILQPSIREMFTVEKEELFYSILPTATQYSRNAMFAGLMPSEIAKLYPNLWLNDDEEGGKNMHEQELLEKQIKRLGKDYRFSYDKITNLKAGKKMVDNFNNLIKNKLSVVVYNFVDMLSHARTDSEMIRELAGDESAYRSITLSWFEHSALLAFMRKAAENKMKVIITTDHGTIRVNDPIKIIGDRNTTTNLRYKAGRNLSYKAKDVFAVKRPEDAYLPKSNVSTSYVFARKDEFFAYPNNFNYYVNYYKNTFQHGGVSLEEMIIPLIVLKPKI